MLRGAGLLLFAAACAALLALISHHADDASLNNANGRAVSNLLGPLGAVAADLLLQTFGFAAVAFLAPPAFWGLRRCPARVCAMPCGGWWPGRWARSPSRRGLASFPRPPACPPVLAA